jgi:hypothetical protein
VAYTKEMTKEEATAFLRRVMGPARRIIEGQEREHLMTVLALIQPTSDSNNQRFWTDVYHHAGKEYHHTTGDDMDQLEEILPDDIQQD